MGSKGNHVVDPQTEQEKLETGKNDCQTPRRTLDEAYPPTEPSDINRAEMVAEARKTGQVVGRRQRIVTTNQNQTETTMFSRRTRVGSQGHKMARSQTPWKATFAGSRLKQPTRPTTSITTTTTIKPTTLEQATHTTEVHDH